MIVCPKCRQASTVIYSRVNVAGTSMRRQRRCLSCGERWATVEGFAPPKAKVLARHGIVVPPELEEDWKTLKRSGFSVLEAAKALKLPVPRIDRA